MTDTQISASVRYLLWSELALYNQIVKTKGSVPSNNLIELYMGLDKEFSDFHIKEFFKEGSIDVVNPLIYSAISEELWGILDKCIMSNNSEDPDRKLFNLIKQKLSSRTTFFRDKNVVGCWAESYIRGSFGIFSSKTTPIITWTFHDDYGKEVDIAGNDYHFALIECGVREDRKRSLLQLRLHRKGNVHSSHKKKLRRGFHEWPQGFENPLLYVGCIFR
jgi:hypothetical protein